MTTLTLSTGGEMNAALGGRADISGDDPVVVLVHGAAMDRTVWQMQTRYLAHRGYRVVALDLPGHGRTGGNPLPSVEANAEWLAGAIAGLDAGPVHLGGHSLGSFIVLHLAATNPELVRSLLLFGIADAMPVHPKLMEAAQANDPLAGQLMSGWALSTDSKVGRHSSPGSSMVGGTQALIESADPGVLANDLGASSSYEGAVEAASKVQAPTTLILGSADKMTPVRNAKGLMEALEDGPAALRTEVIDGCGHMMTLEAPAQVRTILKRVLADA